MNTIPDKIYLQIFGTGEVKENFKDIDAEDVAWSEEKKNLSDVEYHRAKSPWIATKKELPQTWAMLANCSEECFVLVKDKDLLYGTVGHYRGDRNYWSVLTPNGKGGYEYRKADVEYWLPMPYKIVG